MSMLRKAKDLRDRIKVAQGKSQVDSIRTGIRSIRQNTGSRRAGGGKPRAGISLQYKSLQPDPEFEAVLDDIDASSNPLFASPKDRKSTNGSLLSQKPDSGGPRVVGTRSGGGKGKGASAAADDDPLFPSSDNEEEEGEREGQRAVSIDPLLGQVLIPETDSGHTDSDESEELDEHFELDPETVNVIESLHLTDKRHDELFDSASLDSGDHDSEGGKKRKEEGAGEEERGGGKRAEGEGVGGEETSSSALYNESANNNTHVLSLEETGETLLINGSEPTTNSAGILVQVSEAASTSPPRQIHTDTQLDSPSVSTPQQVPLAQPTLDDLLEHGSAALHSRSYSPRRSHCNSPREYSASPLTSSYETEANELFYSITNHSPPVATPTAVGGSKSLAETETRDDLHARSLQRPVNSSEEQASSYESGGNSESAGSAGERKNDAGPERTGNGLDLFSDLAAHKHTPVEIVSQKRGGGRQKTRTGESKEELGFSPTSDHPLSHSDDEDEVEVRKKPVGKSKAPDSEDELFPDDAKYLQDSGVHGAPRSQNLLDIRENYFSSSPEGQRKKKRKKISESPHHPPPPPPPPPSASVAKQNSTGRFAPPRPPRSPQLARRLKLLQEREASGVSRDQLSHKPETVHSLSTGTPRPAVEVEKAEMKMVRPLGSAPYGSTSTAAAPITKPLKDSAVSSPLESWGSSVDPPTPSSSQPLPTSAELHKTATPRTVSRQGSDNDDLFRDDVTSEVSVSAAQAQEGFVEPQFFPLHVQLLIVGALYIYYSFNPFVYLAGLMAGFLTFYLVLGAVFVLYVQNEEEEALTAGSSESPAPELSAAFVRSMNIKFEDYEKRFVTRKFTATLEYDPATHHRKDRLKSDLKLLEDFFLHVQVWNSDFDVVLKHKFDLKNCRISIVPVDVFKNRKRRWSKKYPIRLEVDGVVVFLFADTSRRKEEWYRRLREATLGTTTEKLINRLKVFLQYMQRYFPHEPLRPSRATSSGELSTSATHTTSSSSSSSSKHSLRKHKPSVGTVQFSSAATGECFDDGAISISRSSSSSSSRHRPAQHSISSVSSSVSSSSSVYSHRHSSSLSGNTPGGRQPHGLHSGVNGRPLSASSIQHVHPLPSGGSEAVTPQPSPLSPSQSSSSLVSARKETDWINALAARLCWDVWHENRWKQWVVTRIQKKLVRIKTPGFMESLQLTDVAIGNKMPVINRLCEGPYVKVDGVWVFLDVTYEGLFVMTIKTKLKLGQGQKENKGTEMKAMAPQASHYLAAHRGGVEGGAVSHSHAARSLQDSSVYPDDDSDTGSEDESASTVTHPLEVPLPPHPSQPGHQTAAAAAALPTHKKRERGARLRSVVTKITKKVASTRFVRRAAEKVSKVPLELTVEVKQLKGILAVNIPPPPSDTIWYGFKETPKLELVAKPKLGKKEVTLSQVTHWIERKLCSLVDEKLKLPNMEDLVIPILHSGLPEDTLDLLHSPDPNASLS